MVAHNNTIWSSVMPSGNLARSTSLFSTISAHSRSCAAAIVPGQGSAVHSFEIRKRPFQAVRRQRLLHLFCLSSFSVCRHNAFSIPIQVIAYYIAEHIVMIQTAELMINCFHVATIFNVKLVPGRGSNPHNAARVPGK